MDEQTYVRARDLQHGDVLYPEGQVVRVRPAKDDYVFIEVLHNDGRLLGGSVPREAWVRIRAQDGAE